jgi:hypothetical protein
MLELDQYEKKVTSHGVECGTAVITEYIDADGKVVRRDTNIIVDPEKLPKLGAKVNL